MTGHAGINGILFVAFALGAALGALLTYGLML